MRNRNKINQLGRTTSHRNALMMNLATALITHKRISTTLAKAKALRGYVEPLITKSKEDTTHSRRMVFRHLQSKDAVTELFRNVAPKVGERPGGYTRIIKTGFRAGDSAEMCIIELVDFNEVYTSEKKADSSKKTRRSRRGGGGSPKPEASKNEEAKSEDTSAAAAAAEAVEEVVETVEEVVEDAAEAVAETVEEVVEEVTETKEEESTSEDAADDASASEEEEKKDN
jgi:large subunit ribosomal protein L17